jgi:hypothetical protein
MRAKEQQEDINMKLMQSLKKIEKKLDKESGSRKLGSHMSPNEKRRTKSVRKQHHHSPSNSHKREHNKSSPSPTRKPKRSRVDEL